MKPVGDLLLRGGLGVLLATACPARAAASERPNLALVWEAPEGCPSADTVRDAVVELLRATGPIDPVRVQARVRFEADLYRVRIVTHREGARGVRELEAPTCQALFDAVTIIIALAVDPELFQRGESGEAAAPAEEEPAPEGDTSASASDAEARPESDAAVASASAVTASTTPRSGSGELGDEGLDDYAATGFRDRGLQAVAALAGSVESGALPGLGFGVTVRGGVRKRRFRAELAFTRWLGREAFSAEAGKGAHLSATAVAGWGCFRAIPGHTAPLRELRPQLPPDDQPAIEGGACLGLEVGRISARGMGVSDPGSGSSSFASLGGAMRLGATAAEWLSLDVRVEALRLLHQPRFEIAGVGEVHRPDDWSLRASMGAEVYFP